MLDFLLITIVILVSVKWFQSKPFFWQRSGIPYDVPWPILGATAATLFKPWYEVWACFYKKVGEHSAYGFHFFTNPGLMICDPSLIKRVTVTDADHFMSHGLNPDSSYDPLGKGLFFLDGEEWRVVRAKMTPYFSPARIKLMLPIIQPIAEKFAECMSSAGSKGPVNVYEMSVKLAVDAVVSTAFGLQPDSFDNPNSFFYRLQNELLSFKLSVKIMIKEISPALYKMLRLTAFDSGTLKRLKQLSYDVIDQRMKGIGNRPDFVQGMVDLMMKENSSSHDSSITHYPDGTPVAKFDHFTVTGQFMIIYAGGTETTSNTLTFLLYELALNPDIQEKARQEILSMLAKTKGQYGYTELYELKYVHMVLKETLRMYPVLPSFGRKCTKKFNMNGIEIPVGTMMMITPYGLHHDERYYPQSEKFDPERFLDETNIIPGTYLPFGMGPRTCIGLKLAEVEIALALCKLLPKNRLSVCSKTDIPVKFSRNATLSPANRALWLNVEEIK